MSENSNFNPPKAWLHIDMRHSFMIFTILLLGIFLVASLVVVDYIISLSSNSPSILSNFLKYLKDIELLNGSYLLAPLGVFILYGIGLTIHLLSYFFVTAPAMLLTKLGKKYNCFNDFDNNKLDKILENISKEVSPDERDVFKRGFLYLILQQHNNPISYDLKFVFIQLIYARTISFILWLDTSIFLLYKYPDVGLYWSLLLLSLVCITYIFHINNFEDILRMTYSAHEHTKKSSLIEEKPKSKEAPPNDVMTTPLPKQKGEPQND
ncbi:MAG: hypothetical protein Q8N78_01455 [Sulfurimonas sp.]|nr:hypothetical protein [Sulfurimonas sp.]